jgi:hypothetical protein
MKDLTPPETLLVKMAYEQLCSRADWSNTLASRGLEERQNFEELLTKSVGRVHFS